MFEWWMLIIDALVLYYWAVLLINACGSYWYGEGPWQWWPVLRVWPPKSLAITCLTVHTCIEVENET